MTDNYLFKNKRMRVCSWAGTPGFFSAASAALDQQLRQLIQVDLIKVKSLDDPSMMPVDLLIISAEGVDEEAFPTWIRGISSRIPKAHSIPVPTVIFSAISVSTQRELLRWAVDGNWYFDIVNPDHVSSLPVRIANFLRLHDHLHEVRRMSEASAALTGRVQEMERQLEGLLKGSNL